MPVKDLQINLRIGVGWGAIQDNFVQCRGLFFKDAKGTPTSLVNNVMMLIVSSLEIEKQTLPIN